MKLTMKAITLIIITTLLSITGSAIAADSYSIGISCTIPAIPGVNAPAIVKEEIVASKVNEDAPKEENIKEEETQNPPAIEEESKEQISFKEEKSVFMKVRTVYAR